MDQFFGWVKDNVSVISALSSVLTAIIWILYAQLLFLQYTRQRRSRIFIDQAQGHGPGSVCLLINLSQASVYVSCVMLAASLPHGHVVVQVSDDQAIAPEKDSPRTVENVLKQGPLEPGGFIPLGSFSDLLRRVVTEEGIKPALQTGDIGRQQIEEYARQCPKLEIRVVSMHSTDDQPVGARREFQVMVEDGGVRIRPVRTYTQQLTSRWQRQTVKDWVRQCEEM